jgi:hypothetical protein
MCWTDKCGGPVLSREHGSEAAVLCTGLECEGTRNLALDCVTSILCVFRGQRKLQNRI